MKVLVTGGAGFIGSHIVDFLHQENHDVVVVDNLSSGKKENINHGTFYNSDITEDLSYIFEKEKPDVVIHCAAQVMLRESIKIPIHDAKTNIIGTLNLLEECKKHNIKKIIYTSTGGARYGEPKSLPVCEEHSINPCSPYGISKHTAEHYVQMYCSLNNIDYLIFCFGNVYGPRDDPSCGRVTSVFIDKILKEEQPVIFGDGNQTRDFIYVKDLAEFIVNSIDKNPSTKLFNLANGEQISVNQIFSILKEISGNNLEPKYVQKIKGEVRDIVLDVSKAKKELGWNPSHSFEEGLKETYNWFKESLNKD